MERDNANCITESNGNGDTLLVDKAQAVLDVESESDEGNVSDEGDLSDIEANSVYCSSYSLVNETTVSVTSRKSFALHLSGTVGDKLRIAVSLSDNSCSIYDLEVMSEVSSWRPHRETISGVKFSPQNDKLLYTASRDGRIKLWDTRTKNECVGEFKDDTEGPTKVKPLTCFDVSPSDRHVCAGTDLVGADVFLLFWDIRTSKLQGGYWESHTEEITDVAFHPTSRSKLASCSMDGLINVFDIAEKCEDDALQQCLNAETSLEKLCWFSHGDGDLSSLSCITHTETLQLWDSDGAAPYYQLTRDGLTSALGKKTSDNSYLASVHRMTSNEDLLVLAGSMAGKGECLQMFQVQDSKIKAMSKLIGNKQVVRASWYNVNSEVLVTAGEEGIISVWTDKQRSC